MSIIKRKAGSEDIVKSILEFDEIPTEGSPHLVESGAVAKAIGNLGQPLQWKGPATVAELNAGITGIQPGWTYTLTDAGTLTDGSVDVEIGDEVAWTEDDEWFKVGGDSGKVEVIQVVWDTDHFTYPTYSEIDAIVHTKKKGLCLLVQNPGGSKDCWWVSGKSAASANNYYRFLGERGEELYIYQDGTDKRKYPVVKTGAIAPDYDPSQTYPTVGTAVMQYGTRYVSNTAITTAEEWTPAHWTEKDVETDIVALKSAIGSVKNGGALTDGASVTVPNNALSTLSTAQSTLTLNVNVGSNDVPNFAVEVSPSADCTLTVTKTVGGTPTTLKESVAGGNSLTSGKWYQVTCVGSCWTLAEFKVPTP